MIIIIKSLKAICGHKLICLFLKFYHQINFLKSVDLKILSCRFPGYQFFFCDYYKDYFLKFNINETHYTKILI